MSATCLRNISATSWVPQLPRRSHITFGGAPRRTLKRWKSSSFVTSRQSRSCARCHIASSAKPPAPICRTCNEPGKISSSSRHSSSESCSSKSKRTGSGRRNPLGPTLALSRVCQASPNVFARQLWEFFDQLLLRNAAREVSEHIANRNAGAAHARLSKPDRRINGDALQRIHIYQSTAAQRTRQPDNLDRPGRADRSAPTCTQLDLSLRL